MTTEGDQIVGVVVAAQMLWVDVVDLEAVAAAAAFDGALTLVPMKDPGSDGRGDRLAEMRHGDGTSVSVGPGDPDASLAEDLREGGGSHPQPRSGGDPGLSM